MPRYVYRCERCEITFQAIHSIKEKLTDCEECKAPDTLKRIPSLPVVFNNNSTEQGQETGTLVKEYIEETRGELEQEKKELRSQVYKDD